MENIELIHIWKAQNEKIEKTLAINNILLKEVVNNKAKNSLKSLVRLKTAGIVSFIIYLLLLGYALTYAIGHYSSAWNYFIISIGAIFLINVKGLTDYIKHLSWTKNINYNGSVLEIQSQLSRLQLSIINHAKIMCLQFPFFTTFYLTNLWFPQNVGLGYILFQIVLTGSFVALSVWLYRQHTLENLQKKWFRKMIAGSGGKPVMEAMEFYNEMEEFKKEH